MCCLVVDISPTPGGVLLIHYDLLCDPGDQGFTLNIVTDGKLNVLPKISPVTMSVLGSVSIVLSFGSKLTESNVFVHVMVFSA